MKQVAVLTHDYEGGMAREMEAAARADEARLSQTRTNLQAPSE